MDVAPSELMPCFRYQTGVITLLANTVTRVRTADPNRVAILLANNTTAALLIWFDDTVAANRGFILNQTFVSVQYLFKEIGSLINQEWWLFSAVGGNVTWADIAYTPFTCNESIPEVT